MWPLAALTGFSFKKMFGRFAGTKKVAVITRWPYGEVPLYKIFVRFMIYEIQMSKLHSVDSILVS